MAQGSGRWRLEIIGPDGGRRAVPLAREVVIGRDRSADLRLDDQSISRRHARLFFDEEGEPWVEDLGSGNGVVVDGERLSEPSQLRAGVSFKLGVFTLSMHDVGGPPRSIEKAQAKPTGKAGEIAQEAAAKAKLAAPLAPKGCALRGKVGPLAGKDFALEKNTATVGRVGEGNDLQISDDSISRHHAKLTRTGRGFVVRDLGSANGTSVNGVRIVEQPLQTGDVVRFGTVEFDYFGPPPVAARPLDPRIKKVALGSVVAVGICLLVAGVAKVASVNRAETSQAVVDQRDPVAEAERQVGLAQDARRDEQWDRALAAYKEGMRLDPINRDARKGLKEVEAEIQMKQFFDRARQRIDVGQDEEGVELYLKIDPSSTYYPRAQAEVQRVASLLVRRYLEQCHTAIHYEDTQGVVDGCGHYLNLICNSRADEPILLVVRKAERKLGAKVKIPWACPAGYAHWAIQTGTTQEASLASRIAEKYPDPRLAETVRIYANGQARAALNSLRNLKEVPAEKHNPAVDQLLRSIELAYGAYTDGVSSLETGDGRNSQQQWQLLFDTDKGIMPEGFASEMANQARQQLATWYFKQGQKLFQQERLEEAYKEWNLGSQVAPGDSDLQQGFISLEHEAEQILSNASSCADVKKALAITRAAPESLIHKRARAQAQHSKCRL
ncbi:MAG: FHA domain-containing protein [Deltaproteobacteria bacterium]